jgi:hypothetical protein
MQLGEYSRRLGKQHRAKEATSRAGRPRPAGPAHFEAQSPPHPPPLDLAAIQAIYSPEARSHASTHSPSAAEEQRREGHHLGEERVELAD